MHTNVFTEETKRIFLEEIANEYGFYNENRRVFIARFAPENADSKDVDIAKSLGKDEQEFRDCLGKICEKFNTKTNKRGRKPQGESPWQIANKWLWNEKYMEFCQTRFSSLSLTTEETITLDQSIFKNMLDEQRKKLTSNSLASKNGFRSNRNFDDVYVPLGLVKPKEEPKRDFKNFENNPMIGSQFYSLADYEITEKFSNTEFFEKVLNQEKTHRLAIVGEPGAGKTTLLQKISTWIEKEKPDAQIIWVSLVKLKNKSLKDYLLDEWLKNAKDISETAKAEKDALINTFKAGNVWLLLDGVDEMGINDPLFNLHEQITGCWLKYAKIILSCRLNVWELGINHLHDFEVYRNLDFSEPERDQFIKNWFEENPPLGEQLITELNQDGKERIRDLIKNPLRLTIICFSWNKNKGQLPDTKAELYKECVDAFYDWKAKEAFPTTPTERRELNQALGELAKSSLEQDSAWFRITHQQICECEYLGNPNEEGLGKKAIELGWLNQVGVAEEDPNEEVFAFFHPSFQEYFAALAIKDNKFFLNHIPNNPDNGTYRIIERQWKEVFLIWLGKKNHVSNEAKNNLVAKILNFSDNCGEYYYTNTLFVLVNGLIDFNDCDTLLVDKIVLSLFKIIWGEEDIQIRNNELDSKSSIEVAIYFPYNLILSRWGIQALQMIKKESVIKHLKKKFKLYQDVIVFFVKNSDKSSEVIKEDYHHYFEDVCVEICYELCKLEKNNQEHIDFLLKELELNFLKYQEQTDNHRLIFKCTFLSLKILEFYPSNKLIYEVFNVIRLREETKEVFSFLDFLSLSQKEISDFNSDLCCYFIYWSWFGLTSLVKMTKNLDFCLEFKDEQDMIDSAGIIFLKINESPSEEKLEKLNKKLFDIKIDHITDNKSNDENGFENVLDEDAKNVFENHYCLKLIGELLKSKDTSWSSYIIFSLFVNIQHNTLLESVAKILLTILFNMVTRSLDNDLKNQIKYLLIYTIIHQKLFSYSLSKIVKISQKSLENEDIILIDEIILFLSRNLSYPEFYRAWHNKPEILEISPLGNTAIAQTLNQQILDLPSQLQPTEKTYPLIINAQSLEDETDNSSIAQELCNQIYAIAFPDETNIPEINNFSKLKREIPKIKKQLNTQNLALIFHKGEPNESLNIFCKQLATDTHIHIRWITKQKMEYINGILPQENLVNILQNWINQLD